MEVSGPSRGDAPAGRPTLSVKSAAWFYAALVGVAYAIDAWRGEALDIRWVTPARWVEELCVGLAVGVGVAAVSVALSRSFAMFRAVESALGSLLGHLSWADAVALAVLSGLGEEALFRGALQPMWGLWLTSAAFGLIHGFGVKPLRLWTVSAMLAGVLLGVLAEHYGSLLAPLAAHVAVNALGLKRLSRLAYSSPHSDADGLEANVRRSHEP